MFTSRSIAIDRARRSARGASNMPAIDRKCFDCKQTTSHGLAVCKSMKLASTAFEHVETKTEEVVFREEVDFLSSLAFVVN